MNAHTRARGEAAAEDTERECEVVTKGITPANLCLELSSAQIEIVRNPTEKFGAEFQLPGKVSHQ